ncbi:MAG: hypothetical protein KKB37_17470, partial [Alphaproteobacteria bacterium]|nr:hypothetical protein [Alphaproteobacteria bacterium]
MPLTGNDLLRCPDIRAPGTDLAAHARMATELRYLKCYTASFLGNTMDPLLAEKGFARGLIIFAVPDYGILFRCRALGSAVDLEFAAYFALLRFIKTRLSDQQVKAVQVYSSNPEFVFSFTGKSRHLNNNEERRRLLREYGREFKLAVGYIRPVDNKALISPGDFPSMPVGARIELSPDQSETRTPSIKPFS